MPFTPLLPEWAFIWSARLAVVVAVLCAVLALFTGVTRQRLLGAQASTLLLAGIGAMLYAIWIVTMALYFFGPGAAGR